ncbi:hypothetical protein [Thermostaphylospora chromogena]|uniref:Uncharacterized protein n=1 Tax=Thermostaphylospora chromogena TaxID=35622 RepID=A0A1H1C111_9ACTN|nr:hypothetical protein [Thermostaphylospora chromogena]SDQ57845.1 hypothetical protein SAMN04489764_1236 [Thermostaphylospora chromogena]
MTKPIQFQMYHFTQNNPRGLGQDSVPTLLRRVATTIEELGPVEVHDLIMHNEITEDGLNWPSVTVYFEYKDDEQAESEPEEHQAEAVPGARAEGAPGEQAQTAPGAHAEAVPVEPPPGPDTTAPSRADRPDLLG